MEHIICEVRDEPPPEPEREEKMSMMITMVHHACLRRTKLKARSWTLRRWWKSNFQLTTQTHFCPTLFLQTSTTGRTKEQEKNLEDAKLPMMTSPADLQHQDQPQLPDKKIRPIRTNKITNQPNRTNMPDKKSKDWRKETSNNIKTRCSKKTRQPKSCSLICGSNSWETREPFQQECP